MHSDPIHFILIDAQCSVESLFQNFTYHCQSDRHSGCFQDFVIYTMLNFDRKRWHQRVKDTRNITLGPIISVRSPSIVSSFVFSTANSLLFPLWFLGSSVITDDGTHLLYFMLHQRFNPFLFQWCLPSSHTLFSLCPYLFLRKQRSMRQVTCLNGHHWLNCSEHVIQAGPVRFCSLRI